MAFDGGLSQVTDDIPAWTGKRGGLITSAPYPHPAEQLIELTMHGVKYFTRQPFKRGRLNVCNGRTPDLLGVMSNCLRAKNASFLFLGLANQALRFSCLSIEKHRYEYNYRSNN